MNWLPKVLMATLLALGFQQPIAAQQPGSGTFAPRAEERGTLYDFTIWASGSGSMPDGEPDRLRLPQPKVALDRWLGEFRAFTAAHQARPLGWYSARVTLDISRMGIVTGCRFSENSRLPLSDDAVCTALSTLSFMSALDVSGNALDGTYSITISRERHLARNDAPARELVAKESPIRMTAISPFPQLRPNRFPPPEWWMREYYTEPDWQVTPQAGWQESSADVADGANVATTGIILAWDSSQYSCEVIEASGGPEAAQSACNYARDTLAPRWTGASLHRPKVVPLYIYENIGGEKIAIGPAKQYRTKTDFAAEIEAEFAAQLNNAGVFPSGREASNLRLFLRAGTDGSLEHCRVAQSSGSDAGDIAACRAAYDTVRLLVAEDIFGRPAKYRSLFWDARPDAEYSGG